MCGLEELAVAQTLRTGRSEVGSRRAHDGSFYAGKSVCTQIQVLVHSLTTCAHVRRHALRATPHQPQRSSLRTAPRTVGLRHSAEGRWGPCVYLNPGFPISYPWGKSVTAAPGQVPC